MILEYATGDALAPHLVNKIIRLLKKRNDLPAVFNGEFITMDATGYSPEDIFQIGVNLGQLLMIAVNNPESLDVLGEHI